MGRRGRGIVAVPRPARRVPPAAPTAMRWRPSIAGLSLTEVMVGLAISTMVTAAVMDSFLLLGRNGVRAANHSMMATQGNQALEVLAQDLRMASGITWNGTSSITLTVPHSYGSTANKVTYAWDTDSSSPTHLCFYAMPGTAADSNTRNILVREVASCSFARFNRLDAPTTSDEQTKRIQISMTTRRTDPTTVEARNVLVSSSYILRNKLAN